MIKQVDQNALIQEIKAIRSKIEAVKEWNISEAVAISKNMLEF